MTEHKLTLPTDILLNEAVQNSRLPLCLSDPNLPDNPIVYANDAFFELTLYGADEVIGRNCRFLQGPDTASDSVEKIRAAILSQSVETVEIVNYRRDGSRFINAVQVGPIFDAMGKVTHFFGSQLDITARVEARQLAETIARNEQRHRLGNIVNVLMAITRMSAEREPESRAVADRIARRIRALGEAHMEALSNEASDDTEISSVTDRIIAAYGDDENLNFTLDGAPEQKIGPSALTLVTLLLHELAINSVKHGSLGQLGGHVTMRWRDEGNSLHLNWTESRGPKVETPSEMRGSDLISRMIRAAGGELRHDWQSDGLRVDARLPLD